MNWGCKFFTPKNIADFIANKVGDIDLVVDLFSGSGCLHQPIVKLSKNKIDVIALDIDHSVFSSADNNDSVKFIEADCLDPKNITESIPLIERDKMAVVLNPPFHTVDHEKEKQYWQEISEISPKKFTHRIECLALASALTSAPLGVNIFAIIPETLIRSERLYFFFETLKESYSMKVCRTFKRERFGGAEVDVVIVSLIKLTNTNIVSVINKYIENNKKFNLVKDPSELHFELFRGTVRNISEREKQTSVKDLRVGGIDIEGLKYSSIDDDKKISKTGDILIARVGVRTLGRVGRVINGCAYTNESVLNLRIQEPLKREKVYSSLKSRKFSDWIKKEARGTSNYFLPTNSLKIWITRELL